MQCITAGNRCATSNASAHLSGNSSSEGPVSNRKRPSGEVADCTLPPTCGQTPGGTREGLCGGTASRLTCSRVAQAVRIGGATKKGCQKRTSAFFSRTCTSRPCRARRPAVARPPTPAPITTTFRPLAAAARMTRRAARLPWPRSGGRQEGFAVPSALQAHFMPCMIYADVVCDRDWPGTRSQRLHESCLAWRDGQ